MAETARSIAHLCDMFNFECDVACEILRQCGNRLSDAIALAAELERPGGAPQVASPPDNPWGETTRLAFFVLSEFFPRVFCEKNTSHRQ